MYLLGMNLGGSLLITAVLAFYFFIVLFCYYSDTTKNSFSVEAGREIYTSGEVFLSSSAALTAKTNR